MMMATTMMTMIETIGQFSQEAHTMWRRIKKLTRQVCRAGRAPSPSSQPPRSVCYSRATLSFEWRKFVPVRLLRTNSRLCPLILTSNFKMKQHKCKKSIIIKKQKENGVVEAHTTFTPGKTLLANFHSLSSPWHHNTQRDVYMLMSVQQRHMHAGSRHPCTQCSCSGQSEFLMCQGVSERG